MLFRSVEILRSQSQDYSQHSIEIEAQRSSTCKSGEGGADFALLDQRLDDGKRAVRRTLLQVSIITYLVI